VTHDQGVAAAADRILRMQDGRIVVESQGEPGAREPRQEPAAG
jgi:ABC-type lipoprotein export system ATPase subunit